MKFRNGQNLKDLEIYDLSKKGNQDTKASKD